MAKYKIAEKFISINGEGRLSGQLAVFIRFCNCNLCCSFCDTKWANSTDAKEILDENEIYSFIKENNIKNVTLTGGEPLIQENIIDLLDLLSKDDSIHVEIETNGSINLKPFISKNNPPSFTMDYKLPSSNMEDKMCIDNFSLLTKNDTLKFVVSNNEDLERFYFILKKYNLKDKCNVYISPVYGAIPLESIVEFIKDKNLNDVTMQLQIHKYIWDANKRGV